MGRLTYLIPRLVIISLVAMAAWLARDPIIQRNLVDQAQNVTGAKVEIQQVRTSFANSKLFLKNIQIADPRSPMNNFVQAEMAYVSLDLDALSRRNFVITEGRSSQVVFGAPRTLSGSLIVENDIPDVATEGVRYPPEFESLIRKIGTKWVDEIEPHRSISEKREIEIAELSQEIRRRWSAHLKSQRDDIDGLNPVISRIKSNLASQTGLRNPLRNQAQETNAREELERLDKETSEILQNLQTLHTEISRDKESLQLAKTRDIQKLHQLTHTSQFDGETISQLLLYERQGHLVNEAVQWLRWFRVAVIDPEQDLKPNNQRGITVAFPGVKPSPDFLIKEIQLEGEGRFAKQHLNFAGTAFNLTTQPRLHPCPAIFELRAQGNQHVIVKCEIDRRHDQPVDRLSIQCPDLELDSDVLGHSDSLLVSLGPSSRVQAEIQVELMGNRLSGNLSFHHSKVSLHVDRLHPLAGGSETALRINQNLAKTNQFKANVRLSGSLDDYQFEFDSDLGHQFADTLSQLVASEFDQKVRHQENTIDGIFEREVQNLDQVVSQRLKELANQIEKKVYVIAELQKSIRTAETDDWTNIR